MSNFLVAPPDPRFGIDILSLDTRYDRRRHWRYKVRYHCCGKIGEMTHQNIQRRVKSEIEECTACARRSAARNYNPARNYVADVQRKNWTVGYATWPVPKGSRPRPGDDRWAA